MWGEQRGDDADVFGGGCAGGCFPGDVGARGSFGEEGLLFGDVGAGGVNGPGFGFGVEVCGVPPKLPQDVARELRVVMLREPFGRFWHGEQEK